MDEFSCRVFNTLDNIEYNQEIIKVRRNFWRQKSKEFNTQNSTVVECLIIAGSKAEGITSLHESDVDQMSLFSDAICTENVERFSRIKNFTVIHADTSEAPPGYTRLQLKTCNGHVSRLYMNYCTFESESGDVYLSSSLFATSVKLNLKRKSGGEQVGDLSGPAIEITDINNTSFDNVVAFRCYYVQFLQSWASRPRFYDWPPEDTRKDAASMFAQVVPVGSKGSVNQWRVWRFCFIESELKVTCSLNETQLKLYIILKMVAKEILRHVSSEISSYIMKNITFWLAELLPESVFRKENLLTLLFLSLRFLKSSINKWNWLPYYMIPGRNLLAERLTPVNRRQLSDLIATLILEGPQYILRCTKLRTALHVSLAAPALILKYRETRDLVEILMYLKMLLKLCNAGDSNIRAVDLKLSDIVLPEWRMLMHRGILTENIVALIEERTKTILA